MNLHNQRGLIVRDMEVLEGDVTRIGMEVDKKNYQMFLSTRIQLLSCGRYVTRTFVGSNVALVSKGASRDHE